MKLLAIASREMAEHRLAWAAAGLVALAGAVFPWLKGLAGQPLADARVVVTVGLYLGFVAGLGAVLGGAMIPADLANRRLGFYLCRPVSIATVLAGRFLGAWVLVVGGGAVVLLPLILGQPRHMGNWAGLAAFGALGALYVMLLAHGMAGAWRSRSPWALLGFGAMGLFAGGIFWLEGCLLRGAASRAAPFLLGGAVVLLLPVLLAAAYLPLALGRTDMQRGQRIQALTLAAGLGMLVLGAGAFVAWTRTGGPSSLSTFLLGSVAPRGDWMAVDGYGRFHRQLFLLNAATGETRDGAGSWGRFSGDGQHYAWMDSSPESDSHRVMTLDLGHPGPARAWAFPALERKTVYGLAALSPEGRLGVVVAGKRFILLDLEARRVVFQERVGHDLARSYYTFPAPGVVREYQRFNQGGCLIRELDVASGRWVDTGRMPEGSWLRVLGDGSPYVAARGEDRLRVCDARSGVELGWIPMEHRARWAPLGDGTFAVVESGKEGVRLRIADRSGRECWAMPLPEGRNYLPIPEAGTGRVFLNGYIPGTWRGEVLVADPAHGTLRSVSRAGTLPDYSGGWGSRFLSTRILVAHDRGLLFLRPDGTSRRLMGGARQSYEE